MNSDRSTFDGLAHVVVAGGTPEEWLMMSQDQWITRLETLLEGAVIGAVEWITLLPHHGESLDDVEIKKLRCDLGVNTFVGNFSVTQANVEHGERYLVRNSAGISVIVDPCPDGHKRFAATVESLRLAGVNSNDIEEEVLSRAILAPAVAEPDLVIVLGPPDLIPESMVWELAYSELVFLDLGWDDLTASDLELAIDDFTRRHRRFGGLDS